MSVEELKAVVDNATEENAFFLRPIFASSVTEGADLLESLWPRRMKVYCEARV